jgi:hypothetical protein
MTFERRRPPQEVTPASHALAADAQGISAEVAGALSVRDIAAGSGTGTAFAGCATLAAVIERSGLRGLGSPSNNAEDVDLVSQGKADRTPQSTVAPPDIFAIAPGVAGARGNRRCRVIAGQSAARAGAARLAALWHPGRPPPRGSCLSCDNRTSISRPMA